MNKTILTLFFVLLVGFPQVSSGEEVNLSGKGEGSSGVYVCGDLFVIVDLPKKTIKGFSLNTTEVKTTWEITEVREVSIKGVGDDGAWIVLLRYKINNKVRVWSGKSTDRKGKQVSCEITEKVF
ncbi:MAG: hypothetical protein ACI8PD_001692 [Nitrospinales bacterium]|jgi:hypothetical protein